MAGVKGADNYTVMPQINAVDIVPTGGTTGQVLAKINGTNYNYSWQTPNTVTTQYQYVEIGQSTFTNAIIPYDATVPLSTEGLLYATVVITTTTATSKIFGRFNGWFDTSTNNRNVIISAFRGTTCIDASACNAGTSGRPITSNISFIDLPGSIGTFTYSIRIGTDANTTIYVNRGTTATFGNVSSSQLVLIEVL